MNDEKLDAAALHATAADGPYWNALANGKLMLPRCETCDTWHWPAVFRCGNCGTWDPAWHEVQMHGTIFSWTRSWHAFAGAEGLPVPYVSLIVELPQADGRRLLGVLEGDETKLCIGASVRGRAASTSFASKNIPSLRWTIDS